MVPSLGVEFLVFRARFKVPEGVQIFPEGGGGGEVQLYRGWGGRGGGMESNRLFPIETHVIFHGVPDPLLPGRLAQSVTCLATDACLTADPGVASSIPARSHTFVEIDHEIISTVILLFPLIHSRRVVVSYKRKYVHKLLVNRLFKPAQEKVWLSELTVPAMTIAVDLGRKATKTNNVPPPFGSTLVFSGRIQFWS